MKCHICGKHISDCGGWLERVNQIGVPGVWECRPGCDSPMMSWGDALIAAIDTPTTPSELEP